MNLSISDLKILQLYRRDLAYHNAFHPLELLELNETGKTRGIDIPQYRPVWLDPDIYDPTALTTAIIAHDVVYNPGAPQGENEQASFDLWCKISRLNPGVLLGPLIMATATHNPYTVNVPDRARPLVEHMCDLDMSVLGSTREEFDRNSANVAQEFMTLGYTAEQCRAGRLKFFESVLKQDRIFFTSQFYDNLEAKARQNMIEDLNAG